MKMIASLSFALPALKRASRWGGALLLAAACLAAPLRAQEVAEDPPAEVETALPTITIPAEAADGSVVEIANGTYAPLNLLTEPRTLTLRAATPGLVIIEGGNTERCATLPDNITLEGFVLQNGKARQGGGLRGGVFLNGTIRNCSAVFGGGAYEAKVVNSEVIGCSAEFFGNALYGGSAFSCRIIGNHAADYGAGMAALFGTKAANCLLAENTTPCDTAGALASPVQNMLLYKNTATKDKDSVMTAKAMAQDVCGNGVEEAKMFTAEATLFDDDYTLNLTDAAINDSIKDKGDSALGGFYDLLWHATDLNGRPRILGTDIDIGPYEIADTVEVACTVIGAGAVSASAKTVQEGDTVTFTASNLPGYDRDFLGFYVNGELRTTEMTFSLAITKSDVIEARFQGLSATTENFTAQIAALHPTLREELLLADGAYTLNAETIPDNKKITFKGTTLGGTTLSISGNLKNAILVNTTVTSTAAVSNVTLHRCLVGGLSGTDNITVTSSILKAMPSSLIATMANVTVYGSGNLPESITATNCLVMDTNTSAENFDWVGQAILQKGSDSIDTGAAVSLTPYDNLDIAGRPRKMGSAIDRGAHECFYVVMSVTAEGEYTALTPAPGEHTLLAGDTLSLSRTSARTFLGWTLNGEDLGTEVTTLVIPEESTQHLTATFQGFTLASGDAFPTEATAKDTITLGPGPYNWSNISTEAKIVGTGTQSKVTINGSVTGGRFEAVTLNATLTNATLNRCLVTGGTLSNCTVANSVIEAATLSGGTYVNNTVLSGITLPTGAVNTRTVSAVQEDYTPAVTETTVVDSGAELNNDYQKTLVGDLDYYGNPRINNVRIDLGAAEYVWPPYTVTLAVVGHGLVEPRGAVEVVRGQSLTFTAKADPKHDRGMPVVTVGSETLSGSESHYTYTPTADNTIITVTFPGLTVGESETYTTLSEAIAEAQDGETITVQAGTYRERVDVKTKKLRIVAAEADATQTIIDANHEGRAVALNENSEIVGFTIINGAASEGAGVRGGTVRRCIIRDNTLTYNGFGGGIYGAFAESCLIYNNGSSTQRSSGGGASNSELLNCTVAANAAEKGGGLYDCTAKNCVIALNTDLTGTTSDWAGDSVDPQPDDCCTPTSGGITVDANSIFVRPEAADFRLREGIACLNVAAADERLSALDVFGTQRPYGTGIDMGAIEWNAPDYVVTLSFNSRSQATMVVNEGDSTARTYTCAWNGTLAARTFTVPRFKADGTTRTEIKLTWTKATGSATVRTLSGILLDGGTLSGSSAAANDTGFTWQVTSENTVNVDLSFQAESLTVAPEGNLSQALTDATPGETIKLQDGDYNLAVSVGAGVTLEGTGSSSLLQGATLADGAILKGVTVTGAPVVGPETGSATLLHSIVTGVTDGAGAVKQNVVVKSSLIHNNAAGLGANVTAYLSTVADTDGTALAETAKVYGCAIWRYSRLAETGAEIVDCWAGIEPGFLAPAPEGEDYHLSAHSELIDAAGTAQWPGFTEADRALTDLAGQPRNLLQGYDCGAYEYQGTATVTDWTWFGSAASMDGDLAGAGWRQMTLGSAHALPANVAAVWADRNGYPEANVRADAPLTLSALTIKTVNTCFALLQGAEAGRVTVTGTLMKSAASSLVLAGPLTVQGGTTLSAGTVTLAEGADIKAANVTLNGSTTFRQTGGNFTFGNFFYARDTVTFSLEGGTFKGGELSVAKGSNQTALVFAGADVTLTRIETGDEAGARYGDIIQTGGTVTLTGSGSGKSAPLHISHWPGSSTYSLQGGTLCVPNGEVRLGQDGTGTLRLEGGVAKIRSIGRSNGSVVLAGGTFHALETQALNYVQYVNGTESRLEVADRKTLTFCGTTDSSNTGGLTLGPGKFVAYNTIANRNLTLSAGTRLTLSTADGEALTNRGALNLASPYTLTVPGEGEVPVLTGTLQAAPLAVAKDLPLNTSTRVLQVKGTVSGLTSAYEKCYEITTQRETAEDNTEITNVYVKQILNRPASSTIPVLTVSGQTDWDTAAKWSTGSVPAATTPVIVRATETATLKMPIGGTLAQVTFDVAEGKTLTLDNYNATIAELRLIGAGTLDLGTVARLSYTNQTAFSGTLVVSHASQELKEATIKNQHLRFAVDYALGSCAGFTLAGGIEVAAGKKLTCNSSLAGGEARVEAGATVVIGQGCTNRLNFTAADGQVITLAAGTTGTNPAYLGGNVNAQNWKITDDNGNATKGLTLTGSVTLATPPTSGKLAASALSSLTLKSGKLTLASAWEMPAGAVKAGAGCVTLPAGSSMAGSATFRGPVAFAEKKTFSVSGDLVFRDGSVIYLPIGASFSATGALVVAPGTRVVLTGTPEATQEVDLFKSTQAGGLSISTLTEVALALENPPADKVVTLAPYLTAEGVYGYTLTLTTPNVWTGATDRNWSKAANWSNDTVPADGAAVSFPASATNNNKEVTIDAAIAPSAIRVAGGYTFSGNGPITSKPAIAQSAGEVTWYLFPKAGSYDVASGATAVISSADGYYEGRFTGDGTVRVTGTLELGASSIAFQGGFEVNQGRLALRLGAATASARVNLVDGTLVTKVPATVSTLTLSGTSSLELPLSAPLTVTDTFTASDTVSIAVDAIPKEAGFWLLMTLPEGVVETPFTLTTNSESDTYRAGVVQHGREVFLAVYDSTQIAWAGTGTGADKWVINTSAIEETETASKVVWFHDVDGVGEATVSLPTTPTSVMVTAQTTHFTLNGTFGKVPVTVQSGARVTLAATDMKPSAFANDGTVTVTGTLDLTSTAFSGTGTFIAGTGGTIKVTAQQLAATTNLFKRGGGRLEVSGGDADYTYPSGALSGGIVAEEAGELVKTGSGTLYLQPTAFNESLTIQQGSVALTGTIALKARYFKFEVYERFNDTANTQNAWNWVSWNWASSTWLGLSEVALTLSGERLAWPEGSSIIYFDGGVLDSVVLGMGNRTSFCDGQITNLLDGNTATQFRWLDNYQYASYGQGVNPRTYFVVDAGREVVFSGYDFATPTIPNQFFYKWNVSAANDLQAWHPSASDTGPTENESEIWQTIDERTLAASSSLLKANSWMTTRGYAFTNKGSGFWSSLSGPVKVSSGATFDLTSAVGNTHILEDSLTLASVTGEGTLRVPTSLNLTLDTLNIGKLQLTGSTILTQPITATSATVTTLALDSEVAQAYTDNGGVDFVLLTNCTAKPALSWPDGVPQTTTDSGTWGLVLLEEDKTLHLRLSGSKREIKATISGTKTWSDLQWTDPLGVNVSLTSPTDTIVERVVLVPEGEGATLSSMDFSKFPNLANVLLTEAGGTLTLSDTSALTSNANVLLTVPQAATLRVTSPDSLAFAKNSSGNLQLNNANIRLRGAGTLLLDFVNATNVLKMVGYQGLFTGNITVASGTLEFPNNSSGTGPVYNRTITVAGESAKLATGTNTDATGWSYGSGKFIFRDGATFEVYKRDTYKASIELCGATIRLMAGATESNRGIDLYESPSTTVLATDGATTKNPTVSKLTFAEEASATDRIAYVRGGNWTVNVAEHARFDIEASLGADNSDRTLIKAGAGEMVLATTVNNCLNTLINAGTLRVTGTTGTGSTIVKGGATICGTGTVRGTISFASGGLLAVDPAVVEPLTISRIAQTTSWANITLTGTPTQTFPILRATAENFKLLTDYFKTDEAFPTNDYSLVVVDNVLYAKKTIKQGDVVVEAPKSLQATVPSGTTNWSALTWTTDGTTAVAAEAIDWWQVQTVSLTAAGDGEATVALDLPLYNVQTLNLTGALTLTGSEGKRLNGCTIALADGARATVNGLFDAATAVSLSGNGTVTWAADHTGTLSLTAGTTLTAPAGITLSALDCTAGGTLAVNPDSLYTVTAITGLAKVKATGSISDGASLLKVGSTVAVVNFALDTNFPAGYGLAMDNGILKAVLGSEVMAVVSGAAVWENLTWTDTRGNAFTPTWSNIRAVTLKVTDSATLALPMLSLDSLAIDFGETEGKSLTLDGSTSQTLPALYVLGTNGGDVLCNDGTLKLSALSASAPYVGVTAEMLSTLTAEDYTFDSDALLGLYCADTGTSFSHKFLAAKRGFAIRSGTLVVTKVDNYGTESNNTKIRVDTGATLDAHGYPVSCVLTLNGGTLKNSTSGDNGTSKRQFYSISLTADSTVEATQSLHSIAHSYNEQVIALNGHTLTKTGAGEFSIASATLQGPGTIAVNAGTFALWNGTGKGSAVEENVTLSVTEGATLALRDTRTLKSGSCLTLSGNVEVAGTLTGDGAVTVASGSVTLSGLTTYTGLTTVQNGATLSAAALSGSLTCEDGARLKPREIDTPLSLGGTLTANNLVIDLSAFAEQPETIPLFTSPNELTTTMVATAGRYKPAVVQMEDGNWKLSYIYRFDGDTALTWAGGATGDLADATWRADGEIGLSLRTSNRMIFPANGTYTLTNNSSALAWPTGAVTIGANAKVTLSSTVEQSGLCGDVTLKNGATLKLVDSFAAYAGITGSGATLEMDVSMLSVPRGDLSVGTLKLTGSTLPTGTPRETFSCTTLVFSKELVAAIEAATTAEGAVLTVASRYTDSVVPACDTLPTGYELQKTAEGALVVAFTAPVVTKLYAQVSGSGAWTGLTWYTDEAYTTKPTAIAWGAVTAVTLTNTANAPVALTLPGNLTALTTMTIGSASKAITLSGATLPALSSLTLNGPLTLNGAVISTIPAALSGTGELTLANGGTMKSTQANYGTNFTGRWVVEDGTTLSLEGNSENGSYFLYYDSAVTGSGQLEVRTGATLQIKQANAFGWDGNGMATSSAIGRTVLVVDGGTVAFTGTGNQVIRRPITLKNGARLVNNTCTNLAFTRGCRVDVEGEVTIEGSVAYGLQYGDYDNGGIAPTFNLADGSVVNFNGSLTSLTATAESPSATTFELTGAGTFRFNGSNTYYEATNVGAGVTLGGTGSVANSAITFEEGSQLLAEGGSSVLTLNGATGRAQVVLDELVAESALPIAVLKTAETAAVTLLPPADYQLTSATADGETTHTLDLIRYTALTATVDGTKGWDGLSWQTSNGESIASPRWAWVTALTLNVTADDASLTLPGNFSSLTALTVNGTGTLTLSGGSLPALTTLSLSGNLTLDGAVISTIPASLSGSGTLTFKHAAVSSTRGNSGSNFAYNDFTGRWVVESGATFTLAATATENRKGLLNWDNTVADSGQIEVRAGGTLVVNQKNAFGWDNVSDQKDHTVLVVAGGTVTIGTNEQHFRRKMEWHPGSVLDNQGTQFYLTRGVTMNVVAGESTEPVIFQGNAIKLKGDNACSGNANTAFVVAAGAVLQVDAAIEQSDTNDALTLSGAGTVLLNGANTHTTATTVAAGTTIGGTGSITASSVTLNDGSKILANASGDALILSTVSGSAEIVVPDGFPTTGTTAVLETNSTSTPTLTPPTGYVRSEATAGGVKTVYLEWMPYDSLTADVSGTVALSALNWKTPEGTAVASPDWRFVTAVTFKGLTADATVTMDGELAETVTTLTGAGETVTLAGETAWDVGTRTRTFAGNLALSRALASGTLSVATGATLTLSADNSAFTGTLNLAAGSTLRATQVSALAFAQTDGVVDLGVATLPITGDGVLELALPETETLQVKSSTATPTVRFAGDILVSSGTMKFPNSAVPSSNWADAWGPVYARTITVRGEQAKLATGDTKDATGWSVGTNQKLILEEGGSYELSKRDTFKTPLEMTGGVVRLMYHSDVDNRCALQIFNGQQTTVKAVTGATSASPTISKLTLEASSNPGDWRKAMITNANWQVTVEENAQFYIDAILSSDGAHGFIKSGAGEMVLAAENVYRGVTTVNVGTLRVTGTTGTGATTIKQNAVLCGTGTVKGALTFEERAIFAADPADSLTVNGAVTAGGTVIVRLASVPTETVALLTAASLPAVSAFSAENLPEGFALVVVGNTLYAEKQTAPTLVQATVNGAAAWESLSWQTMAGTALSGTIDWATVEAVTLHISEEATLSGVPALKAGGQLVLDFTAATEKTLTLEASAARTLPAVTISGTAGGNLLANSATFTLTSLAAASGCPYLGTSPELLGTLTASTITFSENVLIGLLCSADGSSLPLGKTLKAPQQGFAIRTGTFQPVQADTFGNNTVNTKIRVDAGAALDVNGYATTCVLTLNGGTLTNTGNGVGSNSRQLANITLTADSVIETSKEINSIDHYYAVQTLTLNGHTLTKRGSATFGFYNASIVGGGGRIVVEEGTLQFSDNDSKANTISGAVTFENKSGTLKLSDAYTIAANSTLTFQGNVTVTGVLTVGSNTGVKIAYDGDVVPTSGLASLDTCEQVTFSDTFWKAVETKTVATGTVFTLATSYGSAGSAKVPDFEPKTGYALQVTSAEDAETTTYALVLTYSGTISDVTAVKATVSGDANWSALAWQDMNGNAVTPMWGVVTSVTLTAQANATVTLDLPLVNLTSLTVAESASTLTLTGRSLSACTFSAFALNGSLTLEGAMLPSIPTCLSGTGTLTFKNAGTVTSTAAGNEDTDTFAYPSFTGRWIAEDSTTLKLAGTGAKKGQFAKNESEGSGQIVVKTGATVKLSANHVFGWRDIDAQCDRTVLVLDGGALVNNAEQYLRRTFELKNGATLSDPNGKFWLARAGRLLVSEGSATILNSGSGPKFGCDGATNDSNSISAPSRIEVREGATLTVEASLSDQNDKYASVTLSGAGKILFNGVNTYTKETTVAAETTIGGTGSIASAVTFTAGAKLLVDPAAEAPLTLNGTITGKAQIILASAPTEPSTAAVKTTAESGTLSTTNFTAPNGYKMTLSEDSKTLYVATAKNVYTSLVGQISTDGMWSAISWTKEDWSTEATDIDWNYVKKVTLFSRASATITVDVPLPSLTKVTTSAMEASVLLTLKCDAALATEPFSVLTEVDVGGSVAFAAKTVAAMPATVDHTSASMAQVFFADNFATATGAKVTLSNCTVVFNGVNTFTAPVTVKKGATLAGSGRLAAAVTFVAGSAVLADGAALTVGTVTVANGATVTVTPAARLADATVLIAANDLTESDFSAPEGYIIRTVDGSTLELSRKITYEDTALESVLSSEVKEQIRKQVCAAAGTEVSGTITTKIEVLHADGSTVKEVEATALEGLLTCFVNHTAATVEGTTATVKVCYDFGVSHITVDAARAVIVTAKVEGQSAAVDFAEGVTFSVVDTNTGMVWSIAPGDRLEQTPGEVRFKIPADRLDDANAQKLLEGFIGTRALRVKVTRQESR